MTKVGIVGSGQVGQSLGKGFCAVGYDTMIGSRTPDSDKLMAWLKETSGKCSTGTFGEAARYGDVVCSQLSGRLPRKP